MRVFHNKMEEHYNHQLFTLKIARAMAILFNQKAVSSLLLLSIFIPLGFATFHVFQALLFYMCIHRVSFASSPVGFTQYPYWVGAFHPSQTSDGTITVKWMGSNSIPTHSFAAIFMSPMSVRNIGTLLRTTNVPTFRRMAFFPPKALFVNVNNVSLVVLCV